MVERVLIEGLRHQFAGVADHVGLDLAQTNTLTGERPEVRTFVVEVRRLVLVVEELDRYAQLLAVSKDAGVPVRETPGPAVVIHALVKVAHLRFAVWTDLGVCGAAPQRPVHTPDAIARLEDADVVAELPELVADRHP